MDLCRPPAAEAYQKTGPRTNLPAQASFSPPWGDRPCGQAVSVVNLSSSLHWKRSLWRAWFWPPG